MYRHGFLKALLIASAIQGDVSYNFCAYSPSDSTAENFVIGWISMVPITKIATAGKIMGGSLAIKGTAFATTATAATTDTLKKIGDKWPGDKTDVTGGSLGENLIDMIFGVPGALWDAIKWVGNTASWAAGGVVGFVGDPIDTMKETYKSCSGSTPVPVLTIHYFSDAELTKPMGDNPHLKPELQSEALP